MDEAEAMAHTVTVTASTVKDWWLHQKQGYSCGYCADVCADARFADLANRLHEGRVNMALRVMCAAALRR
jgi:heterodisulfide reductase subunit C